MKLGFLTQRRLITANIRLNMPALYAFDVVGLFLLVLTYFGVKDLQQFGRGLANVSAASVDFALAGSIGFYGVRVASWIALARRGRMPQPIEWLAFIVPSIIALACLIFSGPLVNAYAAAHNYHLCFKQHDRDGTVLTFARTGASCPAKPTARND